MKGVNNDNYRISFAGKSRFLQMAWKGLACVDSVGARSKGQSIGEWCALRRYTTGVCHFVGETLFFLDSEAP